VAQKGLQYEAEEEALRQADVQAARDAAEDALKLSLINKVRAAAHLDPAPTTPQWGPVPTTPQWAYESDV